MKEIIELILSFLSPKKREEKKIAKKEASVDETLIKAREVEEDPNDPVEFKNNQERLKNEYKELITHNAALYNIIGDLDRYVWEQFKKNIVITMIYRTDAEQDYFYRNSEKYKQKKFKSPHQFWHGVDIRSRTFTQREIDLTVAWLNKTYNASNYYKWTAKCHNVGSGMHFHIQFVRP